MNDSIKKRTQAICLRIDQALESGAPPIAAFDCDGTLWDQDIGNNFFRHQIKHKLVPLPQKPLQYFKQQLEQDKQKAFLWLAQINKGVHIDSVRSWAKEALESLLNLHVFESQQKIIQHLLSKGVKVFFVTASVKWAIEPMAKIYGLKNESVIGITTKIKDNIVTDIQDGPITYGEGKVRSLMQKTNNSPYFLASGNTLGDLYLLESATDIKISIALAQPDQNIFNEEQELLKIAKNKNWYFFE